MKTSLDPHTTAGGTRNSTRPSDHNAPTEAWPILAPLAVPGTLKRRVKNKVNPLPQ